MTWRPLIEITTETAESSMSEAEYRVKSLAMLDRIACGLDLLNARFEEAFETNIEGVDL